MLFLEFWIREFCQQGDIFKSIVVLFVGGKGRDESGSESTRLLLSRFRIGEGGVQGGTGGTLLSLPKES